MRGLVVMAMLVGCLDNETDEAKLGQAAMAAAPDDDGFGFTCRHDYDDATLNTACTTRNGSEGWCDDLGACRRRCNKNGQDVPGEVTNWTCPAGQIVVYIAGTACLCEPKDMQIFGTTHLEPSAL